MAEQKCGLKPGDNTCAHRAGEKLFNLGYADMNDGYGTYQRNSGKIKMLRCSDGYPLRAKEVKAWAAKQGTIVDNRKEIGTYLIYQERPNDGQGHVYVYHEGSFYGNGFYDWADQDKTITTTIYKLN